MGPLQAVVFDWAGTMVDFGSRAPMLAMMAVFDAWGVNPDEAAVRRYMGYAKRDHVAALLAEPDVADAWLAVHARRWTEDDVDTLVAALEPVMAERAADCGALIPGAADVVGWLTARGLRIGSTTGYTRTMMRGVLAAAADQGYAPQAVVCAGETSMGRPAPFMIWRALEILGVTSAPACVVVDDAPVGIEAGVKAGAWTVGVTCSGNGVGLSHDAFTALEPEARTKVAATALRAFEDRRADFIIPSVADLPDVITRIEQRIAQGLRPGDDDSLSMP